MLNITSIHHLAIICSDYTVPKVFYTEILGFEILREVYRPERDSYKLDLKVNVTEVIRTDEYTGKHFVFFSDPDGLPIELYEV